MRQRTLPVLIGQIVSICPEKHLAFRVPDTPINRYILDMLLFSTT
jgi:uncharacterized protein YbbK (DUF523 family)